MTIPESTCWTVIQAAAAGGAADRARFALLYDPVLRAYLAARWRGSSHVQDLDDAVQEIFIERFKQDGVLDRAERGRGFRPFLYGVARNVALRVEANARRQARRAAADVDLEAVPDPEESLAHAFDRAYARALLREAARLQEERAQVAGEAARRRVELLRLRFHDGLPIREIARRWSADPAALHHEYARARQEFRVALREVVAFHHPGPPAEIEQECANLLSLLA